jgi:hypothetical protein
VSDIEIEIDKLLRHLSGRDDLSRETLLRYAQGLSLSDVAGIRESCAKKRVGVGYAVNALKKRQAERNQW